MIRTKSVFSDGRDLVDRDVNCRPLDWKYDNFPLQERNGSEEFGSISLEECLAVGFYNTNDSETNLLDKLVTFIPATSQNKTGRTFTSSN